VCTGIGKATAILFSKLGSNLVIVGRKDNALDETISLCQNDSQVIAIPELFNRSLAFKHL